MENKTTQSDVPCSISSGADGIATDTDPIADGCGAMIEGDSHQQENGSHDHQDNDVENNSCVSGSEPPASSEVAQVQSAENDENQPAEGDVVQGELGDVAQGEPSDGVQGEPSDGVQGESSDVVHNESSDTVQGESSDVVHNESSDTVQGESSDTVHSESCDGVQDEEMKTDSDPAVTATSSQDTGVDGDLLLLTLDGNASDKHAVLINQLQQKEKIISNLRLRVGELEAQLGIMPGMRSPCPKRPPSQFPEGLSPSLKRARGQSLTPSRRIAVHLKSLKRARLRSPLHPNADWSPSPETVDSESQSSGLSLEDLDLLAMEVSHRLSPGLVADVTSQVLQHILPLINMQTDGTENDMVDDASLSTSFLSDANIGDGPDSVDSYTMESDPITTSSAVQSGTSVSPATQPGPAISVSTTSSGQIHIPNIFRQRHAPMQPASNTARHMGPLPVRHSVRMSGSNQFSMNMHRMPMPPNMGSASANALLMQQLMNTAGGAQAAQTLSHLTQMNRFAALQAQQRGMRPPLQNARFPAPVSPMMSPRVSSAGPGMNMNQARNMAMNAAAFRRAVSSRVVTGQRLNMNNR